MARTLPPADVETIAPMPDLPDQTCAVPPSPELLDAWRKALEAANKPARGAKATAGPLLQLRREPRRLGFNDGVIVPPEEFPVGTPIAAIRAAAADRAPLRGTVRVSVVLVDFSDKAMTATQQHFEDLFFSTGVLPHGSVKEYYQEVTNGLVTLTGDVVGPYRMPHTLAWYANNGSGIGLNGTAFRSPTLAHDAAVAANPDVNFAPYDNDGNGFVDAFIVVHAGSGAEQTGALGDIWSHKSTLSSAYSADGTKIYGYLTIPEDARIGVSCHELGHLLFGFPDLYDTDYSSEGIGEWCLMASGSWNGGGDVPAHPSAWCKANQGWVTTTVVTTNATITVPQVETSHQVFRLWKDGAAGTEYFLLENRQKTGYDAQMKGSGLLLWHVDESQPGNTDESHYKVALLQADGHRDLELNHNRSDAGDPFPGSSNVTVVNGTTTPNTKSYANADTCVALSAIAASSAAMSVHVQVSCKTILKDAIKDKKELVKETAKDRVKELAKDAKDATKETKELKKEAVKELKEVAKDLKEIAKERVKDVVEKRPKELKEVKEVREGWDFDRPWERQLGAAGQPGVAGVQAGADELLAVIADLASRVAALESGEAAAPFIGEELRPDLAGAQPMADDTALRARLEAGDPGAKREFDGPVR